VPRKVRGENDRRVLASTVETAPRHAATTRPAGKEPAEGERVSSPACDGLSDELDDKHGFSNHSRSQDDTKSFTLEEEKFIKHAAAWLAPRTNADELLSWLGTMLQRSRAASSPQGAADKERGDGSNKPRGVAEAGPAAGGKKT
jgi:hypothetical protein